MSLIFHYAPLSSASTTHWALEELGVPYEKVRHAFDTGELKKPEYLKLNPNGKVPCLVVDGTPIFESIAIIAYLGETYGVDKKLFPAPGMQRAQALQWLAWANTSLGEALSRFLHNHSERIPKEQQNAKAAEVGKADVEKHLEILDGALKGKKFLVGDSFSLVDVHLAGYAGYLGMCGFDLTKFPNVDAYNKTCSSRAAFGKIMKPDA
ncbi:MAG: glutathione S-transferase family protein [Polyangiales bacterium]